MKKMLQPMKTAFWEKWAENFKNLASTFYAKKHFGTHKSGWIRTWLYRAGCSGKKTFCLKGQPWKMKNFI